MWGRWVGVSLCAVLALAVPALAQVPRTPDGHPDFQGVWDANFVTQLERPDGVADLVVAPGDAAEVVKKLIYKPDGVYDPDIDYFSPDQLLSVNGELRSSWLIEPRDGHLPLTHLAMAAKDAAFTLFKSGYDNPEERPPSERCVVSLGYPPLQAVSFVIPSQIVQTPDAIVIWTEDTDGARIIHMTGPEPPEAIRTRQGYSRGHWEGDTLVVVTTGFAAQDPGGLLLHSDIPLGEGSRVTERFALQADGELLYRFTAADPDLYNRPWLAEYTLKRLDGRLYEYACHEGNDGMTGALRAARMGRQTSPATPATPQAAKPK